MSMASVLGSCCRLWVANLRPKADTYGKEDKRLAAKVHLTTKLPTLVLEDIDHLFSEVTCSESTITLSFAAASAKSTAMQDLGLQDSFYLITSHRTCNMDGERTVYL